MPKSYSVLVLEKYRENVKEFLINSNTVSDDLVESFETILTPFNNDLETLIGNIMRQFQSEKGVLLNESPFDYILVESNFISKICELETLNLFADSDDLELVILRQSIYDK